MRDLLRLARLLGPHWRRLALGIGLALATVLANVGLLALSSWFIASMAIAGSLGVAMDYTLPAAGVRALAIVRALGRYAERLVNHDTTFRILGSLRLWFYRRIEPLAPARLAGLRSGDLLARIRADIDTLDDFYIRGIVPAIVALIAGACILPFLWRYDPSLAWIDGLGLLAAGLAAPLALAALAARAGADSVARSAELRASIVEDIEGMAELVVLGAAGPRARLMDELSTRLDGSRRRLSSLQGLGEAAVVAASSLSVAGAAFVLAGLVGSGALPPADMAMLTVFVLASFETILPLPTAIQKSGEMAAAAGRLFEILDAQPEVIDAAASSAAAVGAGTNGSAVPRTAALSLRELRFQYPEPAIWKRERERETSAGIKPALQLHSQLHVGVPSRSIHKLRDTKLVLDGLSFELPAGTTLGLAGPSGAGKSTVVSLLLRFWDYQGGRIELDGRDLRSYSLAQSRRYFSVLPQAPFLYHASIRENLLLAADPEGYALDPTVEERLLDALEAARLSELVSKLSEGLDTIVGETGAALSTGEAQRLALARVFLKKAPIYLLDEPTEGLDDANAEALLETIADRLAGASILIISHRERDFGIADRVLRLGAERDKPDLPAS